MFDNINLYLDLYSSISTWQLCRCDSSPQRDRIHNREQYVQEERTVNPIIPVLSLSMNEKKYCRRRWLRWGYNLSDMVTMSTWLITTARRDFSKRALYRHRRQLAEWNIARLASVWRKSSQCFQYLLCYSLLAVSPLQWSILLPDSDISLQLTLPPD